MAGVACRRGPSGPCKRLGLEAPWPSRSIHRSAADQFRVAVTPTRNSSSVKRIASQVSRAVIQHACDALSVARITIVTEKPIFSTPPGNNLTNLCESQLLRRNQGEDRVFSVAGEMMPW